MPLPPDEPNDEEKLEQLPEDYDTPDAPPADAVVNISDGEVESRRPTLDSTHPATDTDIQNDIYYAGLSEAAAAQEPNANDAVTGYDKAKDIRRQRPSM